MILGLILLVVLLGLLKFFHLKKENNINLDKTVEIKKDENKNPKIEKVLDNKMSLADYKKQIIDSISKGDYKSAGKIATEGISNYKNDPELFYLDSMTKAHIGDKKGALVSITEAVKLDNKNTTYWKYEIEIQRQILYLANVKTTDAEYKDKLKNLYEQALVATNENIEIVMAYAIFWTDVGDKVKSIEYWNKAIKINPKSALSYQNEIDRLKSK